MNWINRCPYDDATSVQVPEIDRRTLKVSLNTEKTHSCCFSPNSTLMGSSKPLCIIHFSEFCFNILPIEKMSERHGICCSLK